MITTSRQHPAARHESIVPKAAVQFTRHPFAAALRQEFRARHIGPALLASALWLAPVPPAAAVDVPFASQTVSPTGAPDSPDGARSVHAADLDGDGDLDLLSASSVDDEIAWYENTGRLSFERHLISATANGAASVFAADLDADGDLDVLSASFTDNKVAWYENEVAEVSGDRSFTLHTISTMVTTAYSVHAADLDGDGDVDVVAAAQSTGIVNVFYNDGADDPTFPAAAVVRDGVRGVSSVHAEDIDGDGDNDLLVAKYANDSVVVLLNDGMPTPSFSLSPISSVANGARSVYAKDLDQDGDMDVLSASRDDHKIAWYENTGDPSFTLHTISTSAMSARSVYATDVDGDGDIDVLSASLQDDKIAWYENDGDQNFDNTRTITTGANGASSVFAADVDGDGDTDVLSASQFDDRIALYENQTIHRSAVFPEQQQVNGLGSLPFSIYATDINGDGDVDLLTGFVLSGELAYYENNGDTPATFSEALVAETPGPTSVFASDLDGDGDQDLLAAIPGNNTVDWFENDPNDPMAMVGFVQRKVTGDSIPPQPSSVHAADFDGDGDIDVLSCNLATIAWHENDGAAQPSFTTRTVAVTDYAVRSVYASDVDGDGDIDVVGVSPFYNTVTWYENDGAADPSFELRTISDTATAARSVFTTDLDRDGDTDVLVALGDPADFQTFIVAPRPRLAPSAPGQWAGPFEQERGRASLPPAATGLGSGGGTKAPRYPVLNASPLGEQIILYINDGNQGFFERVISDDADDPFSVYATDMDGDGDLDVLSASFNDDKIAWYENDGSQRFTPRTVTTQADGAVSVFATDLDRDGDVDVMSGSGNDGKLAVYFNEGGQFALDTSSLIPNVVTSGDTDVPVLRIEGLHRGRIGDHDVRLTSFQLLFESADDPPVELTSAGANALVDELLVYRDDGDNNFEPTQDTLVTRIETLELSEDEPVVGLVTVEFNDSDPGVSFRVNIPEPNPVTYFVALDIADDADTLSPEFLRVTHLTQFDFTSSAEDALADIPLTLERTQEVFALINPVDGQDSTPAQFDFPDVMDAPFRSLQVAGPITVMGTAIPSRISVTGGSYSIGCNISNYTTRVATIMPGATVCVRHTAANTPGTTVTTRLTIGGVFSDFSSTTQANDTTPDPFGFMPATGVPRGSMVESNTITVQGINVLVPISVVGGLYLIDDGSFRSSPGMIARGQQVTVQHTASADPLDSVTTTLTIGGTSGTFTSTTAEGDIVPDPFTFRDFVNVGRNTVQTSGAITVAGIDGPSPVMVAGGTFSINGAAFDAPARAVVRNGDTVRVRHTSAETFNTAVNTMLTIGGISDTFTSTTIAADTRPNAFNFENQTGVPLNSERTSNAITVSGINTGAPISVSGAPGSTYSIGAGPFTSLAGTVQNGNTVRVRHTAGSLSGDTKTTTLNIGGVTDSFSSTTTAGDTTPNTFSFTDVTGVAPGSVQTSNLITVSGTNASSPISVSNGSYSIGCNSANFTAAAGFIMPGATVCVRHTASASALTTVTTTLNIGGVSDGFSSTTRGTTPTTPQVSFATASMSVTEGVGTARVRVQLSAPAERSVTVPITFSGTATRNSDYEAVTASAVIPAGQSTVDLSIRIINDTRKEDKETIRLTMGTPTNATLGSVKVHTLTIQAND